MSDDCLSCPYDLKYCPETIDAFERFAQKVQEQLESESGDLIFQPDGFSTDFPPCEDNVRLSCVRYLTWEKNNRNEQQR